METTHFVLGLIFLLGISGCRKENYSLIEKFSISYTKASGWIGSTFKATLTHDGVLEIIEDRPVDTFKQQTSYRISDEEINKIIAELEALSEIEVKDKYGFGNNKPTDLPVTIISYSTDFYSDSTTIYCPNKKELPKELDAFISTISDLVEKKDSLMQLAVN